MRNSRFLLIFLLLIATQLRAAEGRIRRSPNAVKDEYIVILNDDTPQDEIPAVARRLASQHHGDLRRVWQYAVKGFFIIMNEPQAQALSRHPDVKYIEENAEMFFSATVPTNVNPACTPGPGVNCTVADNRLWHLDAIDQNSAVPTRDYSYCETGNGVYVYVIDTGVMRAHREFNNDPNKVLNGYDASGDPADFPAWDPCSGPGIDAPDGPRDAAAVRGNAGHGTGVASLINGVNVGVARGAKVVPVKVRPCARDGARKLSSSTPFTSYATNETVFVPGQNYMTVTQGGTTGSSATYPSTFPTLANPCCVTWGSVTLRYLGTAALPGGATVQMTIDGIDWILRPANPYPKSPAVVSLSTYRVVGEDGVTNIPQGATLSLEDAIGNLLRYNGGFGITVVASANNQEGNACDTSPGRMSRGNPANPNDPLHPYKVITAGGAMIRNNPDFNFADGGPFVSQWEPAYDSTKAVRYARWRCHAGDSDICSGNVYGNPPAVAPNPITQRSLYIQTTLGSNGGQCVSLFAPAKNIPVANLDGFNTYRDPRTTGGTASGTSWSAPIVSGIIARILENNPMFNVDQVFTAVMSRTTADLDPVELNPPGQQGTPNALLRLTPVVVQPLPVLTPVTGGGAVTITVSASGAGGLTYELYRVNPGFDWQTWSSGAASATRISGPTASNSFTVFPTTTTSYYVRVRSSCGTADTNITTAVIPDAPTNLVATANGSAVTVSWNTVSNADGYRIERKLGFGGWQLVANVGPSTSTIVDFPNAPNLVVVYRVFGLFGSTNGPRSNYDPAYVGTFSNDPIISPTPIRAEHITELRRATNTLMDIAEHAIPFGAAALDPNLLRGQPIADAHFHTILQFINEARTELFLTPLSFNPAPAAAGPVLPAQIQVLRNAFK